MAFANQNRSIADVLRDVLSQLTLLTLIESALGDWTWPNHRRVSSAHSGAGNPAGGRGRGLGAERNAPCRGERNCGRLRLGTWIYSGCHRDIPAAGEKFNPQQNYSAAAARRRGGKATDEERL